MSPKNNEASQNILMMAGIKFLSVLLLFPTVAFAANNILSVAVQTDDCSNCGMSFLGRIELLICGKDNLCCNTGVLDDPSHDDYNAGTVSRFSGDMLGKCNHFNLNTTVPNEMSMKITHIGTDSGKFNWVVAITQDHTYQCNFHQLLDNDDFEVSKECTYVPR